jgi:uncharacterized RDD family membrane protein YckC
MRIAERLRVATGLLRWLLPVALMMLCARADGPVRTLPAVATSSGSHLWWVESAGEAWVVMHAAQDSERSGLVRHEVARFADRPVALVAEGARVWVVFGGVRGRSEVLSGEAIRNPASGLWFVAPAGLRLRASVPIERVETMAAVGGELWCPVPGRSMALRLAGEDWREVELPASAGPDVARDMVEVRGRLWLLARLPEGGSLRWFREGGAWIPAALTAPEWTRAIEGASMLTLQAESGEIGVVEAGTFVPRVEVPRAARALGWGDGSAFLSMDQGAPMVALHASLEPLATAFAAVPEQRSVASRWFHLPLLGVLSLGALMLAAIVKAARAIGGRVATGAVPAAMSTTSRLLALAIDAAPLGLASMLAFDASPAELAAVPLWSTDLRESMPFVWMALGTAAFGALEECAGSRSMGKRMLGGVVARADGSRAAWWRHVVRNLLKGLLMLSPILALPTLTSRRGIGVPEGVTDTAVVQV